MNKTWDAWNAFKAAIVEYSAGRTAENFTKLRFAVIAVCELFDQITLTRYPHSQPAEFTPLANFVENWRASPDNVLAEYWVSRNGGISGDGLAEINDVEGNLANIVARS